MTEAELQDIERSSEGTAARALIAEIRRLRRAMLTAKHEEQYDEQKWDRLMALLPDIAAEMGYEVEPR